MIQSGVLRDEAVFHASWCRWVEFNCHSW